MKRDLKKAVYALLLVPAGVSAYEAEPSQTATQEYQDQQAVEQTEQASEVEALAKEPTISTIDFLSKQAPAYLLSPERVTFAREQIKQGQKLLEALSKDGKNEFALQTGKSFLEVQRKYLDAIIALCWRLFDKAVVAGHGFTGGTIVFEDKGHTIFNFLFDYAQKANENLNGEKRDPKYISQNCFAYERHSSHFPEMQDSYGQYGIDIRYGDGDLEKLLPANKSHILFGKVVSNKKDLTFIKMEVYGLCMRDASVIKHGLEFLKGTKGKKGPSRREDLPKVVKALSDKMLEAIPKKSRAEIADEIGKPPVINKIYSVAKKLAQQKNVPASKQAAALVKYLEDTFDHLDIRRGNEVILVPL